MFRYIKPPEEKLTFFAGSQSLDRFSRMIQDTSRNRKFDSPWIPATVPVVVGSHRMIEKPWPVRLLLIMKLGTIVLIDRSLASWSLFRSSAPRKAAMILTISRIPRTSPLSA